MMDDRTDLFEIRYVFIGKDGKYHVEENAPEKIKKEFKEFFDTIERRDGDIITLAKKHS